MEEIFLFKHLKKSQREKQRRQKFFLRFETNGEFFKKEFAF